MLRSRSWHVRLTNNRNLDSVVELDFTGYDRHSISDWLLLLEDESEMKESFLSAHCAIAIFIITIPLDAVDRPARYPTTEPLLSTPSARGHHMRSGDMTFAVVPDREQDENS